MGLSCLIAIKSLLTTGDIAYLFGLPTLGRGPFEHHGLPTTVPLVGVFLLVCLLETMAGWLAWNGRLSGAILALALLPAGAVFWWGFALPYPPILAVVWALLLLAGWRHLDKTFA